MKHGRAWRQKTKSTNAPSAGLTARDVAVSPAPGVSSDTIADLRLRLGVSQVVFAKALNISPDTVRGWEQGKRVPDGASLRLLELAEQHPEWVLDAVKPTFRVRRGGGR